MSYLNRLMVKCARNLPYAQPDVQYLMLLNLYYIFFIFIIINYLEKQPNFQMSATKNIPKYPHMLSTMKFLALEGLVAVCDWDNNQTRFLQGANDGCCSH